MNTPFHCIQCQATEGECTLSECIDYYLSNPYQASYFRCKTCGLLQQHPIPSNASTFYEAYPVHQKKSFLHIILRKFLMGAAYFNTRTYLTQNRGPRTLLDYGCGDGWFLEMNQNKNLKLIGFETDKNNANSLSKKLDLPVYHAPEKMIQDWAGKVDCVTMNFVLEHLTHPLQSFETVQKILKPDGLFFFSIPNINSWEFKLFGKKWHNLDSPRHISFPTRTHVEAFAKRSGFQVIEQQFLPFPNGVAGSLPVVISGKFRFWLFLLFLPVGLVLSRFFPQGIVGYTVKKSGLPSHPENKGSRDQS